MAYILYILRLVEVSTKRKEARQWHYKTIYCGI